MKTKNNGVKLSVWTEAPIHRVQGEHSSWPAVASRCFELDTMAATECYRVLQSATECYRVICGASSSSKCSSKPLPSHSENPLVQCISDLFPGLIVSLETSVAIWRCSLSISAQCFKWQNHPIYGLFLLVLLDKSNLMLPKESARLLHGHVLMKCLHSFQFQAVSLRDSQSNQQLPQ